ncbi:MAG TPA: ABC transporter ATP-binding protein [Clostridia bacterium]|nr:ABC transporter ATP-binding protein [Clostridia bacterium]
MNAVQISNLTKSYGKSRGITDVSFEIPQGEVFGFIGPNGAGKSTTIRTILAFLYPDSGSAEIFGMDCIKDAAKIKQVIGYLPSEVNYYDDMRVKDLFIYSAKFYKKDCSKRINELSNIFELDVNKKIDSLSFGNKKKVGIIQALLHEPKLIILDEPTSGLDPLMQLNFFEVLEEENKKGATIFFSSHNLSEVERMCDRVAIIKEGRILKVESIDKLKDSKYKKVRIEHTGELKIDLPRAKNMTLEGHTTEFLFSGPIEEIINSLHGKKIDNLWIEEPSLEEIFLHYYEKEAN